MKKEIRVLRRVIVSQTYHRVVHVLRRLFRSPISLSNFLYHKIYVELVIHLFACVNVFGVGIAFDCLHEIGP